MKRVVISIFCMAAFITMNVLVGCNKSDFFTIPKNTPDSGSTSKKQIIVKLYLETSSSMRGYVNPNTPGDYKLVSYLPRLITDIENKKNGYDSLELFTITNESKKFIGSNDNFTNLLRTGDLMTGGSSVLHSMIKQIIDSTNENNNISMFVSDCILDLGTKKHEKVNSERSLLTNEIYRILSHRKNISAIVYQYYSDFNGDYYFNSINQKPCPFAGETLHDRPFYIWVFGNPDNLISFMEKDLMNNYSNMFTFGLSNIPVIYKSCDLKISRFTNVRFSESDTLLKFTKAPGVINLGISTRKLPSYVNLSYLRENLVIDKNYLKIDIEVKSEDSLEFFRKDNVNSEKDINKIKSLFQENNFDYLITLKFTDLPKEDFVLILNKDVTKSKEWVKKSSINDDVGIDIAKLEGKTFSLTEFIEAFSDTYKADTLFSIKFKYHKK